MSSTCLTITSFSWRQFWNYNSLFDFTELFPTRSCANMIVFFQQMQYVMLVLFFRIAIVLELPGRLILWHSEQNSTIDVHITENDDVDVCNLAQVGTFSSPFASISKASRSGLTMYVSHAPVRLLLENRREERKRVLVKVAIFMGSTTKWWSITFDTRSSCVENHHQVFSSDPKTCKMSVWWG